MRYTKYYLPLLFLFFFLVGCNTSKKEKRYVIGVSQCMLDDAWRQAMVKEMQIEASNYDNIEIIVKDANSNNDTQIRQIKELINDKVDVLIISPFQSNPITEVAEEAYKAGIPTIITDRKVNTDLYTTFVGADNYTIGYAAGSYAARYLPPSASILEIWGLSSSSPAQERHQGFIDALVKRSDLSFRKVEGEWVYDTAKVRLKQLEWSFKVDFVYSHNDMMAIAAREYFIEKAPEWAEKLPIIGVDAVAGAGLEAVADGRINVSFLYPTGGEQVIRTAMKIINGESVQKYIPLQTGEIDKISARTLLIQSARLLNYQKRIEQQRTNLDTLLNRFNFLQDSFLIISVLMIGFVLLSIYTFLINFKLKKTNHELREINRKEEEQREKLIQLNAEIKEVTAQKLQFFTNISHEVRTPLTLILGPLDKLLKLMHDSPYLRDLQLMQKNADHLLRVINQILDFRKVENKQEKLKIRNTDLIAFIREIKSYFESMATVRHINFTFTSELKECMLWFDPVMMEKVLVNLLSNAFKFTPENGTVHISLAEVDNKIQILVEDSGRGIPFILLCFIGIMCHVGIDVGTNTTAPKILMERLGMGLHEASFATSLYFILRTFGCFLGAFILTRMSAKIFFGISVLMMLAAMAGLSVFQSKEIIYICIGLIGFGNSNVFSVIFSQAIQSMPQRKNEISGLMIMGLFGGTIFPLFMGFLSDAMASQLGAIIVLSIGVLYLAFLCPKLKH